MILLFITLFSSIFVLFGCFFVIIAVYSHVVGNAKGALFLPSNRLQIKTMVDLAEIRKGTRVVDLGSGDGAIILEAAREGAIAIGIEFNPFLVRYSRWRAKRRKISDRVTIIKGDMMDYSLRDADVVFLYLLPKTLEKMSEKLRLELSDNARIVSNTFILPGWTPIKEKDGIFLYQQKICKNTHSMLK